MIGFAKRNYWVFIFVVLLISLGQTLFMVPWQDDNALFFKLAHIEEPAGFLGSGIFGERAYKYTALFYYPVYLIFGHNEFFYFLFGFLMFALGTYAVYKLIEAILDKKTAKFGTFLYACGFIGSESFIRLFNSVVTSISIILVSIFIYCYWNFFKKKKAWWYILSLVVFFLAAEFARARTHYLIIVPILLETFFFAFRKDAKSFAYSLARIIPFVPIFLRYVIIEDYRSGSVVIFIQKLISGKFYQIYGFLASLTNFVLPGWFGLNLRISFLMLILVFLIWLYRERKDKRLPIALFFTLSLIWKILSARIFITPALTISQSQIFSAFLGGEIVLLSLFAVFFVARKSRSLYLFLLFSVYAGIASYSFYYPLLAYEKINRYFSHPFFYLVLLLSLIFYLARQAGKKKSIAVAIIIAAWGASNLVESLVYQRSINIKRSSPVRSFYSQLRELMPEIQPGSALYFDVADDSKSVFADAFSVAQMPDTTALAWRYGIDRYDFEMFEDSEKLASFLRKSEIKGNNIRSFYYSGGILTDTTADLSWQLKKNKTMEEISVDEIESIFAGESKIEINGLNIVSILPSKVLVDIEAEPLPVSEIKFPFSYGLTEGSYSAEQNHSLAEMFFEYGRFKEKFRKNEFTASSFWEDRVVENLSDGNEESVWQANRLSWLKESQFITIKTDGEIYDRLAFINSFSDWTPVQFEISASADGTNWEIIKEFDNKERFKNGELAVFNFDPVSANYFRILFKKTLNDDSPAVSEIWLVPQMFDGIDIYEAEKFLVNPFKFVTDSKNYFDLIEGSLYTGSVELSWTNNKNLAWQSSPKDVNRVIFDGRRRTYSFVLPAGGTRIDKLMLRIKDFPGKMKIHSIARSISL